jgi:hypothetical protein
LLNSDKSDTADKSASVGVADNHYVSTTRSDTNRVDMRIGHLQHTDAERSGGLDEFDSSVREDSNLDDDAYDDFDSSVSDDDKAYQARSAQTFRETGQDSLESIRAQTIARMQITLTFPTSTMLAMSNP